MDSLKEKRKSWLIARGCISGSIVIFLTIENKLRIRANSNLIFPNLLWTFFLLQRKAKYNFILFPNILFEYNGMEYTAWAHCICACRQNSPYLSRARGNMPRNRDLTALYSLCYIPRTEKSASSSILCQLHSVFQMLHYSQVHFIYKRLKKWTKSRYTIYNHKYISFA